MKRLRSVSLISVLAFSWVGLITTDAQEKVFTITDMRGVALSDKKDTLEIGMRIAEDAPISLSGEQAVLELLDSETGIFHMVFPVSRAGQDKIETFSLKKYFLSVNHAMTRGDKEIRTLEGFERYYSGPGFLIFEKSRCKIQIPGLLIDEKNLLFLQFETKGKVVNIRLDIAKGEVLIDEGVFLLNGDFILPGGAVKIGYYQSEKQQTTILVENFNPVFVKRSEIEAGIIQKADLFRSMSNADSASVLKALESYIFINHGFVGESDLTDWYLNRYER